MGQGLERLSDVARRVRRETAKVIIGQERVIDQSLVVIFTRSHALIEGVPGVAKTLLTRTLARTLGCEFQRIQFTPDQMPSDITGTNVFNLQTNTFTLVRGPVFTSFLLADEINRAPAKTQSALLQAMQERAVSIDRVTHALPANFTVFATQNPIEYEGTYPLPEAQKDRFMMKIPMGWPERDEEMELARRTLAGDSPEQVLERAQVETVVTDGELDGLRAALAEVLVRDEIMRYIVEVVRATRSHSGVLVGAGPRATQALAVGCRALAALAGRDFVTPDDIKEMAEPVLGHRLVLRPEFEIEGLAVGEVVRQILDTVAVPR